MIDGFKQRAIMLTITHTNFMLLISLDIFFIFLDAPNQENSSSKKECVHAIKKMQANTLFALPV